MESIDECYQLAKKLIEKASSLTLKSLNKIKNISYKKSCFNLVTNVDQEVEQLILKEIYSRFPNHTIIAEESGIHKKIVLLLG